MSQCKYSKGWAGSCTKQAISIDGYCEDHMSSKCVVCGKQATHECSETNQFVCGADLCDDCTHDLNHPSGNWFHHCSKQHIKDRNQKIKEQKDDKENNKLYDLWSSVSVENRLYICKLINDYLDDIPVSERQGMKQINKQEMFDYIMQEGRGYFNPVIVENCINFMFKDGNFNDA